MFISPFGPAADGARNEESRAEVGRLLEEAVEVGEKATDAAKKLVELYKKEADKHKRLAEVERGRRREVEARLRACSKLLDEGPDLEAKLNSMIPDLVQAAASLPPPPEVSELQARLEATEKDRDAFAELLDTATKERDAALRARDAAIARLQPRRREDEQSPGDAEALKARLHAPTLRGVLEQAQRHCSSLVITADMDETKKLEHHQKAPHWRDRLAATLATMQVYVEAKDLAQARGGRAGPELANLKAYCMSQPFPLLAEDKVILGEGQTASSSPRGKAQRTLRVPEYIDPSGKALMLEHIRVGDGAPPAPRLHYLDDTNRSGQLVIGFFGDHRYNAGTN
jgi:DNA repair exonuclease SbcCD ATPase subunit